MFGTGQATLRQITGRALLASMLTLVALLVTVPTASATQRQRHHGSRARAKGCANADATTGSVPLSAMKAAVVCLINQQRTAHGLPAMQESTRLDRSAQGWTATMVSQGDFSHGTDFAGRISATGYDWSTAGENIATGYPTPRQVVGAWMASPDHCRNILNPGFADVGTGVVGHGIAPFATGGSTWTQDFGLWMDHRAPSGNTGPMNAC